MCKLDPIFGTLTHGHVSLQEQHLPVEHIPFWLCTMLSNIDRMADHLKMFGDSVLRFSVLNTNVYTRNGNELNTQWNRIKHAMVKK